MALVYASSGDEKKVDLITIKELTDDGIILKAFSDADLIMDDTTKTGRYCGVCP